MDNLPSPQENLIQHGLRQFSRGCVLLARMIRAENRGGELVKHIVAELEVGDPFDRGPKLQNPQPGIESELPKSDDNTKITKRIEFAFEIRTAVQ